MRKAETFSRTSRWIDVFATTLRAIHDGAWLGLLDRREVNELTNRFYSASTPYLGEAHNLAGLFAWEQAIVDRFFQGRHAVLVAATGAGREVIGLARRGFQVDGFDCNPELLSVARTLLAREGLTAGFTLASPDSVPDDLGRYDAGVVGHGAYMHMRGRDTRIRFLDGFRKHLQPNSPIVVSFMMRGPSRRDRLIHRTGRLVHGLRAGVPPVELGDTLFGRFEHWFTKDEMRQEIEEAGLRLEYFDEGPSSHLVGWT